MFEQQMSQSIEAGAPDITYSGNEGPKSPQQEQQMMMEQQMMEQEQQMMAPVDYSSPAFKTELIEKLMEIEGLDLGAATAKAEWIIRNKLKPRKGAAFGGIMGLDGRRKYGWGSKIKDRIRKIIPNEVAKVAEVAAPFVAPFNPLAAGLMSGIGGFDRTGRIGSSIKSGLMNYGMGQLARGIGGGMDNLQTGFNPAGGMSNAASSGFGKYFTSPVSSQGGLGKMFSDKLSTSGGSMVEGVDESGLQKIVDAAADKNLSPAELISKQASEAFVKNTQAPNLGLLEKFTKYALDPKLLTGLAAGTLGATALMGNMEPEEIQDMQRGEGLDIEGIRAEVIEAMKDSSGEKLLALRSKYPYLGTQASKNTAIMAYGGRIRRAEGGLMNLGGMEKDYRAEGGFVPIGAKEKADDVPARLSVNEFVFTADAVRSAGGGDIDKGAEVMERVMKNLEAGGQISEDSQGLQGAREMFQTSQRLGEVL
jgi:hypothetical protein